MKWIDTKMSLPLEKGYYSCLVDVDGYGSLEEFLDEYFEGKDWCHFKSHRQFIRYWWAKKEDYQYLNDYWDGELEKHNKEMAEHANNFGGL